MGLQPSIRSTFKMLLAKRGSLQRSSAWLEYNIVRAKQMLLVKRPLTATKAAEVAASEVPPSRSQ